MSVRIHIVSTRTLSDMSVHKLSAQGWQLTAHDFIRKQMVIPENLSVQSLAENIVITSQAGVKAFLKILHQYHFSKDVFHLFCTDQATLKSVTEAGLHIKASAPHAAALADKILSDKNIKSVTHICSNRRRDELSERLKSSGVNVRDVVAYHTEFTPVRIESGYDAILFLSPSAVDSFLSVNSIHPAICFCIGQTTAHHAKQKGYQHTYIAATPSEDALVQELINHYAKTSAHAKE